MGRLLLLFVLVPMVELILLVEMGRLVGLPATLGLIFVTGAVGAALARHQGLAVVGRIRQEMAAGRLPGAALVDGALVLVAGALLLTPGILTDAVGFTCLVPAARRRIRGYLARRFENALRQGRVHMRTSSRWEFRGGPRNASPGDNDVIDVEWRETDEAAASEERQPEDRRLQGGDLKGERREDG